MTSPALIRYRARAAERRFLIDELRKRRDQLDDLVREFNETDMQNTHIRLRRFRDEATRCITLLERLPEPKKPARRKRKARLLQLVKRTS